LPVAAYAVEAGYIASRESLLQWSVARAAEDASQDVDLQGLRSNGTLSLNATWVRSTAGQTLAGADPRAHLEMVTVSGQTVTVTVWEYVPAGIAFWVPGGRVRIHATAAARLTSGYASPSS